MSSSLHRMSSRVTVWIIRQQLWEVVKEAVRSVLTACVQAPGASPWTSYLFVGCAVDGPFIFEIGTDRRTRITPAQVTPPLGAAISSLLRPGWPGSLQCACTRALRAKLIAYRVVDDAIGWRACLGPPIQMIEIRKPMAGQTATASRLSEDDLKILGDKVAEWKVVEGDTLAQFVGLAAEKAEGSEPTTNLSSSPAPPSSVPANRDPVPLATLGASAPAPSAGRSSR